MANTTTVPKHDIPMRRRRRPLVDYLAIDEENERKAAETESSEDEHGEGEEKVVKKPKGMKFNPVIGNENPHGKPPIPPAAGRAASKSKIK